MRFVATFLVWLAVPLMAAADGFSAASVLAFQRSGDAFSITLARAAASHESTIAPLGVCKQVRVFGTLDAKSAEINRAITLEGHRQALALLERAHRSGSAVSFGQVGRGLVVIDRSQPCVFKSKGLLYWKEPKAEAVLSVFHRFGT